MPFFAESAFSTLASVQTWRESRAVSIFGLYENYPSGARVFELCRSLAAYLGPRCRVRQRVWPFRDVRSVQSGSEAVREAATADLVIISVERGDYVPVELEQWCELYFGHEQVQSKALCAILSSAPTEPGPLQLSLAKVAQTHNLEFVLVTGQG